MSPTLTSRGAGDDEARKRLLIRCISYLKDLFLRKTDPRPRSFEEILKETYNTDAYPTIKEWVHQTGLRGVDRVEVTSDGKFVYKPPLPCRGVSSLWDLLQEYETKRLGMLQTDVLDSIPGEGQGVAEQAINALRERDKIFVLGEVDDKLKILVVKDAIYRLLPQNSQDAIDLLNSVDISQVDEQHINEQLRKSGMNLDRKMPKRPPQLPFITRKPNIRKKREKANNGSTQPGSVRHIKQNSHVLDDLQDYSEPVKASKRTKKKRKG